jgi:NAD(P)-dependent dehydrogenase (short-subunit alcohol dehydrogenase family)
VKVDLSGQVALVAGAATGIGNADAEGLLAGRVLRRRPYAADRCLSARRPSARRVILSGSE